MQNTEFSRVFSSNYSKYLSYANKLTQSSEDAKDVLQDAAIKAYNNLHQLNDIKNFSPWFYRVIYSIFISQFNKRKRRNDLLKTNGNHPSLFFNKSKVRNQGYEALKQKDVIKHIEALDNKYKDAFLLHTYGYSYQEISDSYDIPIGTVKSRINMARKKIKHNPYITTAA